jgi:hypothetical protein
MDEMWRRYVAEPDPEDVAADWSRLAAALDEMSDGVTADPVPAW